MARPAICPKCGEELNIPEEFFGKNVRCAGCANVFQPTAQTESPPRVQPTRNEFDEDLPSRRASQPDDDDDRPQRGIRRPVRREMRSAPRSRGGSLWIWLTLGGLFGICALGCVGVIIFAQFLENPKMQTYDSPDGAFKAGFPGKPNVATTVDELGRPKTAVELTRKMLQDTYFVHVVDLKSKPTNDTETTKLLEDSADALVAKRPGNVEIDRMDTNVQGYPALELQIEHADDTTTFVRLIVVGKRLYQVGVTGKSLMDDSPRQRLFWDEFRIKDGEATTLPPAGKVDDKNKSKAKEPEKDKTTEKGKEKTKPKPKLNEPDDL